jgi:hypothetical protein
MKTDGTNLNEKDLIKFIGLMSVGDMGNPHAFGYFNSKVSFKDSGNFDYKKLDKDKLIQDNFVVGHNRFATGYYFEDFSDDCSIKESSQKEQGDSKKHSKENLKDDVWFKGNPFISNPMSLDIMSFNPMSNMNNFSMIKEMIKEMFSDKKTTLNVPKEKNFHAIKEDDSPLRSFPKKEINHHPFILGDFVLVHNGVINNDYELRDTFNIKTDIKTDSYVILWLLNHFFRKSIANTRQKRIVDSIQKTTNILKGWYSIILFDKVSKEIYYFRNKQAEFCFGYINNNLLIGTTNRNNFKYVFNLPVYKKFFRKNDFLENNFFVPRPETIYLIKSKKEGRKIIKKIGYFGNLRYTLLKQGRTKMKGGKNKI